MDNPYLPPASATAGAPTAPPVAPALEVPEDILKKIKAAWIAALVSAGITLVVVALSMSGKPLYNFDAWALLDVGLMLGLAFGIHRKSRTCAVLMLCYFIYSKVVLLAQGAPVTSLPVALMFLYFYWLGVVGTFKYHAFLKNPFPAA